MVENPDAEASQWKAYCLFHNGQYEDAFQIYNRELEKRSAEGNDASDVALRLAVCSYRLGRFAAARQFLERQRRSSSTQSFAPAEASLRTRLHLHLAYESGAADEVEALAAELSDSVEDQLSLLALRVRQGRYDEAGRGYTEMLEAQSELTALGYYAALCYARLEAHDVSLELVDAYLKQNPESVAAASLRTCNAYKLHGAEVADAVLKESLGEACALRHPLLLHNSAVFRPTDDSRHVRQVWEAVAATLPEAETNLVLHHLREGNDRDAEQRASQREPQTALEYVAKGLALVVNSRRHDAGARLAEGLRCLEKVGCSDAEKDTILGRQCVAFAYLCKEEYDDARVFLESIQDYVTDDVFRWNYALCLLHDGDYREAQAQLEAIHRPDFTEELAYARLLARCYVANGLAEFAWSLFQKFDTATQSTLLLEQIADDCYLTGAFRIAARAFDVLQTLDPDAGYWPGKRGAILAAFRSVLTHAESTDCIDELLQLLAEDDHIESAQIRNAMWTWSEQNVV